MPWKILWLDNDLALITAYVDELRLAGHEVVTAKYFSDAMEVLKPRTFDLLILDVMIPTMSAEEEEIFPPSATEYGYMGGLAFYRWLRGRPELVGTPVLVFTVLLQAAVRDAFVAEGLPAACFATKFSLMNPADLVSRVEEVLAGR